MVWSVMSTSYVAHQPGFQSFSSLYFETCGIPVRRQTSGSAEAWMPCCPIVNLSWCPRPGSPDHIRSQ